MAKDIYLSGLAYEVGESRDLSRLNVEDVEAKARLLANGLVAYRHSDLSAAELAVRALKKTMAEWTGDARDIDAILYCTESFGAEHGPVAFKELCEDNGIRDRPVIGVTLGGCANLVGALRIARGLIQAEGLRNVALVTTSAATSPDARLAPFDLAVLSDAAAGCIVSGAAAGAQFRISGIGHASTPYLDRTAGRPQLAVAVATGVRRALTLARAEAGLDDDEAFPYMISTSTHAAVMEVMGNYCGVPSGATYLGGVELFGHCYSADLIINLLESATWRAEKGSAGNQPFLLLGMSVGSWGAMVCEAVSADDKSASGEPRQLPGEPSSDDPDPNRSLRDQVIDLLVILTGNDKLRSATDDARFDDLGVEPLAYANFLTTLEKTFELKFADRELELARMTTLRDILDVLDGHIAIDREAACAGLKTASPVN